MVLEQQHILLEHQSSTLEKLSALQLRQQVQLDLILAAVSGTSAANGSSIAGTASQRRAAVTAPITAFAVPQTGVALEPESPSASREYEKPQICQTGLQ